VFSKPPDILQIQIPPPLLPPPVSVEIIDNSRGLPQAKNNILRIL